MFSTLHQILTANGSLVRKYWSSYWQVRQVELSGSGYPPSDPDPRIKAVMATDSIESKYLLIQLIFDLSRRPSQMRAHCVFKVSDEWGSMRFYIDAPEEALASGLVFSSGYFTVQTT